MLPQFDFTRLDDCPPDQEEYVREQNVMLPTGKISVSEMRWGGVTRNTWTCSHNYLTFRFTSQPRAAWVAYPGSRSNIRESIGRFFFVPARHQVESGGKEGHHRSISCFLSPELFDVVVPNASWNDDALRNGLRLNGAEIEWLMLKLQKEITDGGLASEVVIESICAMLPVAIFRAIGAETGSARRTGGLTAWSMRRIRERIQSDLPPPNLSELADLVGMSVRHLTRAFKEETGETIAAHVRNATLQRAVTMLASTQVEVGEVASSLGFSTTSSFIKAFRRMTGMRPGEARRLGMLPSRMHVQ